MMNNSLGNRIRVAYHQKDGLQKDNIDKSNPRFIDTTEQLPPLDISDGDLGNQYLKVFQDIVEDTIRNHEELKKDLESLPGYINAVLEVTNERLDTFALKYEETMDFTDRQLEILRLGYYVEQQNSIERLNNHLNKLMKRLHYNEVIRETTNKLENKPEQLDLKTQPRIHLKPVTLKMEPSDEENKEQLLKALLDLDL